jgi:transposase
MDDWGCPGCRSRDALLAQRDARIADLERRVGELEALTRELLARLGQNSSNSSRPPSADPPGTPAPTAKKRTGRKPGGQPGHPPRLKRLLPPQRVSRTEDFVPRQCVRCRAALPERPRPGDPEPTRHQVADLPAVRAEVVEYRGHARSCPCCGHVTRAAIPAALRAHSVGPGLAATLGYLAGCHHVSKRGLEEIAEAVFDVPLALGTVSRLEREMGAALAGAHAEALAAVRAAPVKNVDETGWKLAGKLCWLWVAATATAAAFVIHARRGLDGLIAVLGEVVGGVVGSDRWSAYDRLSVLQRQVCWAHLRRDFRALAERGGPAAALGREGLRAARLVFRAWHLFRGGGLTRERLQLRLERTARRLEAALAAGRCCADRKAARFCANVLGLWPAVWRFAVTDGVEPTNNHAERLLRKGVLWRKNAFGCSSADGCRFVERVLTVTQTLRLQGRHVLSFLRDSLIAHRQGRPSPKLVEVG